LKTIAIKNNLNWGKDFAIVISSDAVHYGDEDWGGKNFATYGADSVGFDKAVAHEKEIIDSSLTGIISSEKIKKFNQYTVKEDDYKAYKWTWCGRYSIPFGLLTTMYLSKELKTNIPKGKLMGYKTSITNKKIKVEDLGMGVTAPAHIRHWVGYAAITYN
jgi:predicted class III extradiol MEMO1 family dioxygenase